MLGGQTCRTYPLETRSLLYFIAVAEEQNIGRAAARLHITQPALTRQIQSLEEEVGVPLFIRTANGVEITPAGTALLQHARTIRAEIAQAKTHALQADSDQYQKLDIGVYGSAVFSVVPDILSGFSKKYPNVEFRLHNSRKDQQIEFLRQGKTLIAFDRFLPQEPDLACELVYREHFYVALHKDHPLAKRESIDIRDLENESRIGANFDIALATNISRVFGSRPIVKHRADDMLTTLSLVSAGLGIAFAPPSIHALQIPNVVYRPCAGCASFPFDVQCMYRKNDQSPLLHAMLESVREYRAAHSPGTG